MSIRVERGPDGRIRAKVVADEHDHWNDGCDTCGTCGCMVLPDDEQLGKAYAVLHDDGWHIAEWDGECFAVTSSWQSGDRWRPAQVRTFLVLPILDDDGAS